MTSYPLTDELIEKIKKESYLIADSNINRHLLYHNVTRQLVKLVTVSTLDKDTVIKIASGLIGLYTTDQNQK